MCRNSTGGDNRVTTRRRGNGSYNLWRHFKIRSPPFSSSPSDDVFSTQVSSQFEWPFEEKPLSTVFSSFFAGPRLDPDKSWLRVFSSFPSMAAFRKKLILTSSSQTVPLSRAPASKRPLPDGQTFPDNKRQRKPGQKRGQEIKKRNKIIVKSKNKREIRKHQAAQKHTVGTISVRYVNMGLRGLSHRSLQECAMFAEHDSVDFLFVSEAKLQEGDQSFKREIKGFDVQEFLRPTGPSGGIVLLAKDDTNFVTDVWEGDLAACESWMQSERVWLRINHDGEKSAVCGVYLRQNNRKYYDRNQQLLNKLEQEITILSQLGYTCSILGDLNSHIGSRGAHGIAGNPHGVNRNGQILIRFLDNCNLKVLNKSEWVKSDGTIGNCTGKYTFFGANSVSILDYGLFPREQIGYG